MGWMTQWKSQQFTGHTFSIPESVMGLTVFAIGGCTPELITGVIMARRGKFSFSIASIWSNSPNYFDLGQAGTGLANSFGTSSMGIFMCLGAPWLVKTLMKLYSDGSGFVSLGEAAVKYLILSLLLIPPVLWTIFACFKFHLRKLSGMCLALTYGVFITWAILIEVQILFPTGKVCWNINTEMSNKELEKIFVNKFRQFLTDDCLGKENTAASLLSFRVANESWNPFSNEPIRTQF